jgi:hypothetical protein
VRAAALEALEAELGKQRARGRARLVAPAAGDPQRQRRVVQRVEPGQQRVVLGHEDRGGALHGPARRRGQAADEVEQRRLAAAAGAHDGDDLAGRDGQRHAVERLDRAEAPGHRVEAHRRFVAWRRKV